MEWMLLACAFAQEAPKAKAPDAALFDELIHKTNELRAFEAIYGVHVPDQEDEFSIRILFRAPDEVKCEIVGHGLMSVHDESLEIRSSDGNGKSIRASVPFAEQSQERWRRLTEVLHAEFTGATGDWPATMSFAPQVDMRITDDGEGTKENFQFKVEYAFPRTAVLGWLETFKYWKGTQTEDEDHVVFRTARGSELSLSKHTGFIDSIRKEKKEGVSTFVLEKLDLDPKLDDNAFDLPEPAADAMDASAQLSAQLQGATTLSLRSSLFTWIASRVTDGKLEWNAESRAHIRKMLETLHSDAIVLETEPWASATKRWMEGNGAWLRERYAGLAKSDTAAREELETKVKESRGKVFDNLQQTLQSRLSGLTVDARAVSDATLRSNLAELEKSCVESAFEHVLQNPLLETFDALVERAKGGG